MPGANTDLRAKLRPAGGQGGNGYRLPFGGPGAALRATGGIVFPFTPSVTTSQGAEYAQHELIHANYRQNSFVRSKSPEIAVNAQFNPQTKEEGLYFLGVLHFLRVVTKMHFGPADPDRGTPPPVLEFSAYGKAMFHRVPVLVESFECNLDDDVDYMEVEVDSVLDSEFGAAPFSPRSRGVRGKPSAAKVPLNAALTISLLTHYSPQRQRAFDMRDFASGRLYQGGFI